MTLAARLFVSALIVLIMGLTSAFAQQLAALDTLTQQWPNTDLPNASLEAEEIRVFSKRDETNPLNKPTYLPLDLVDGQFAGLEPVIVVERNGVVRGYPMRIVAAHGVINDELGGAPITVSYCKICSSAMVFGRVIDGTETRIEPTGITYQDNMVLFDTTSETWYQQINGMSLAGSNYGRDLEIVPSKITSIARFKDSYKDDPQALLVNLTTLSQSPMMAKLNLPVPSDAGLPDGVDPRDRVVVVGNDAYPLDVLRQYKRIEREGTIIHYEPGRLAAPDAFGRDAGRDVGTITVLTQKLGTAELAEVQTHVNLAHAFRTFRKDGVIRNPFTDPLDKKVPDRD